MARSVQVPSGDARVRALLLLTLASLLAGAPAGALPTATVLSIGDGDTIRVRQDIGLVRVRLACIDAPETSQSPWGAAARRELQGLLPIGSVIEVRRKATDRYGRTVAEVFSGGRNINQALVGSGAAFVYWQYITGCDRNAYSRLETEARLRRLGVWSIPGGITRPWSHRRMRHTGQAQSGSGAQQARWGRRQATMISIARRDCHPVATANAMPHLISVC